jgi:hypothetical protein
MMNKIFRGANEVLIWLGKESLTDLNTFGLLREFEDESIPLPAIAAFSSRMLDSGGKITLSIAALFQRQWFHRILQ